MKTIKGTIIPALACLLALLIAVICFRKIWLRHCAAGNTKIEDPDNEKTEDTALDALLEHRAEGEKYIVQDVCLINRPEAGIPLPCRSTTKRTTWSARWIP